jgi:hypothetical protein
MTQHMPTNSTTTSSKLTDYATSVIIKNRNTNDTTDLSKTDSSSTSSVNLINGSSNLNLARPNFYEITKEYYSKNRQKNITSNNKLKSLNKNVIFEENEHDLLDLASIDRPKSNRLKPINTNDNTKHPKSSSTASSKHREMIPPSIRSTTSIDENIIEQSIDLNLYKTSPTIAFIKQKYKMYLEWLNENNKKEVLNKNASSINPNGKALNINQLTWYSYERSLRSQHNNHNSHSHSHSHPNKMNSNSSKKVTIEISSESKNVNNIRLNTHNLNNNNNNNNKIPNLKINNINAASLSTMSTSGISSSVLSSTSSIENNLNSSFSKNVKFHQGENINKNKKQKNKTSYLTLKKINQSNTSLNNTNNVNTNNLTTPSKNIPNYSNNSTPMLSMTSQPTAIKPILKSTNLSNSMNDYYYNSSSLLQGSINNNGGQMVRRDSVQSSSESNNDMTSNNSFTNISLLRKLNTGSVNGSLSSMSKTNGVNGSGVGGGGLIITLPPIARGSNDFNAVMQDLKKKDF